MAPRPSRPARPRPAAPAIPGRITVRHVAARAGVSTATVSRALSAPGRVDAALERRVLEAAAALDYRPNRAARSLRIRRSLTLGVIIPDIQNFFFTGIVRGIEDVLQREEYTYLLGNSDGRSDREQVYVETLRAEGVAGFIIVPSQRDPRAYRELVDAGLPIVALDRVPPGITVDHVAVTNTEGVQEAVGHLIRLGHRRIGFIGGPANISVAQERLTGYRAALQDADLPVDPALVQPGDFQQATGYAATNALLDLPEPPTALFVSSNLMTLGALQALHERRLRIPEDVAIVGFDDIPWANSLQPPLTTVAQPTYDLGVTAAQLLLARLREPQRPLRRVVLETRLMVRGSCGARRARHM